MSSQSCDDARTKLAHADQYGWRWFILLGVALVILGVMAIAHIRVAGMISSFVVGVIILLAGGLGLGLASRVHDGETHSFWRLSAILYLVAGIAVLASPFVDDRLLSLVLAVALVVAGLSRLVAGAHLQCTPVLISGAATIVVGTAIGIDLRDNLLWILGYLIAGDLFVQGVTLVAAGQQLHHSVGRQNN